MSSVSDIQTFHRIQCSVRLNNLNRVLAFLSAVLVEEVFIKIQRDCFGGVYTYNSVIKTWTELAQANSPFSNILYILLDIDESIFFD